jgi:hypothetical protein
MRLRVCAGVLALVLSGCAHIPEHVLVIVDGNRIEVVKAPSAPPAEDADDEEE